MPSMACLILQAAARVSSSVSLVTYRFAVATRAAAAAAAARSGSGGVAASDPLKHFSFVAAARTPRSRLSHDSWSTIDQLNPVLDRSPYVEPDWDNFEANEKDLESDDALWDLYERWCKFFDQERDREEMARRFRYFKKTVLKVEEIKKSNLPYRLGINMFADGKLRELYRRRSTRNYVRRRSASPIYGSELLRVIRGQARRAGRPIYGSELIWAERLVGRRN